MDDMDDLIVDRAIEIIKQLQKERDDALEQAERWEDDALRLLNERNKALKERDEARRMYCEEVEHHHETVWNDGERDFKPLPALDVAISKGWDCFKENGK